MEALFNRPRPTPWQQFQSQPYNYLAHILHSCRPRTHHTTTGPASAPSIDIVCISDTHNTTLEIPPGEMLIHAGDATQSGTLAELQATIDWLDEFPHRHKIMIGGNHDLILDDEVVKVGGTEVPSLIDWKSIVYLQNSTVSVKCVGGRHLTVHGSPMTPKHGNWAFQYPRAQDVWSGTVPLDTDILVTHGPPRGHLDLGHGCDNLLGELWRVKPKLHVFGHIHEGYGEDHISYDDQQRAYEDMIVRRGGFWSLVVLCYRTIRARMSSSSPSCCTLLVNAAVVGGIRDERRKVAVVVRI